MLNLFNKLLALVIPRNIDDTEIIIRFAFEGDYRRKKPYIEENINIREIFFDNRFEFFPVSVLRKLYVKSEDCLARGQAIQPNLKSLIVFRKKDFDKAVEKNSLVRTEFQAHIIGTPLDENNNYIIPEIEVDTDTLGNPAHADIRILNPGIVQADAENANTAIRSFSSVLFKYCKVITLTETSDITEESFNELFPSDSN